MHTDLHDKISHYIGEMNTGTEFTLRELMGKIDGCSASAITNEITRIRKNGGIIVVGKTKGRRAQLVSIYQRTSVCAEDAIRRKRKVSKSIKDEKYTELSDAAHSFLYGNLALPVGKLRTYQGLT